jgi:hypothetical protein
MLAIFSVFVQQILLTGGLKVSALPGNLYRALYPEGTHIRTPLRATAADVTAAEKMLKEPGVPIDALIEPAKALPGNLIVDDASNPKYASLQGLIRKLFIPATSGYCQGYRVLPFLWEAGGIRFPVAFALRHSGRPSLQELALQGFSLLRSQAGLKPQAVPADSGYGSQEIVKRLTDCGWPFISRFKKNQHLSGQWIGHLIPRGYGEVTGTLENHAEVKVIRRQKHFLQCNRMTWEAGKIRDLYAKRRHIEEVFRILKSCLDLSGCQQHSIQRQVLYVLLCRVALAWLELYPGMSPYEAGRAVISGKIVPEILLKQQLFAA